jgi:hypothetical protein
MAVHLIVKQGPDLIADVPDYDGPIPAVGTYLFHPPLHPKDEGTEHWNGGIAGCVKTVTMAIYGRPQKGEDYFTGRNTNVVEVHI